MKIFQSMGMSKATVLSISLFFLFQVIFNACNDDGDIPDTAYFQIEGDPANLRVGVAGGESKVYVISSNRPWKIVAKSEGDWVKVSPVEGKNDGTFKFIVDANPGFESRTMNFAFVVDGEEQPTLFRIDQRSNAAELMVESEGDMQIPVEGGEVAIKVSSNIEWNYIVDGSWVTHKREGDKILVSAPQNTETTELSLTVAIFAPGHPALKEEIIVTQKSGAIILEEDFNWLNYGNAIPYETGGEKRYDTWTEAEKARGWYSTPVPGANNEQLCYARPGFVKLGKTNWGGDLISPKLEKIEGVANVKVTFKAAGYISAGNGTTTNGAKDDNLLKIFVLGAGTPSVELFTIDNFPNDKLADNNGVVNDIWADDRAYSFTITGATSETQIKFLGRDYALTGVGQGKNRIFLDDIKVVFIFD